MTVGELIRELTNYPMDARVRLWAEEDKAPYEDAKALAPAQEVSAWHADDGSIPYITIFGCEAQSSSERLLAVGG